MNLYDVLKSFFILALFTTSILMKTLLLSLVITFDNGLDRGRYLFWNKNGEIVDAGKYMIWYKRINDKDNKYPFKIKMEMFQETDVK